jgi:membrane peptidoglycan carboxypeptidase
VGFTPTLSTAVWMGYKEGNIPLRGIHGVGQVVGGTWPARMWHDFMTEAMKGVPATDFTQPAPGATGTRTATASSSPHPNVGALVALRPA